MRELAGIVKAERAKGVPMLFFHAGDCFSPSLMSGFDQGEHIVALTNMGRRRLRARQSRVRLRQGQLSQAASANRISPIFAANLREAAGLPLPGHKDSQIFELGGIKVGVFGIALPDTPQLSSPGDLKFCRRWSLCARRRGRCAPQGADIVVAVAHTDRAMDYAIVRSRLVDVLLTGHDHDLAVAYDGKAVMVESNEEGNYVTAIDIAMSVTRRGRGKRTVTWSPIVPRQRFAAVDARSRGRSPR